MFVAYTKDNKRFIENKDYQDRGFSWNDIPQDAGITALTLTHPIPLIVNSKRISSKVSIKKYHYYYFFNEATVSVSQVGDKKQGNEKFTLVAKVMAGIDVNKKYVLEIRLDKFGNTSIDSYPLSALIKKFEYGQMNKSILKTGISCTKEKRLL